MLVDAALVLLGAWADWVLRELRRAVAGWYFSQQAAFFEELFHAPA